MRWSLPLTLLGVLFASPATAVAVPLTYESLFTVTNNPVAPTLTFSYDTDTALFADVIVSWDASSRFPRDLTSDFNRPCQGNFKICSGDQTTLFAVLTGDAPLTWAIHLGGMESTFTISTAGFRYGYVFPGQTPSLSDSGTLVVIPAPEPSSLALLAVGCLFLRRRH